MKKSGLLQEIRLMRFEELVSQWTEKKITQEEAARILGVSDRTFRRYCRSYEESGASGLYDARLEKKSHNAVPVDEMMEVLTLFETRYSNFTAAHFYDVYRDKHQGERSYNWVRLILQDAGLTQKAKKRGAHRRKRPRAPMKGMLLHQDGSTHEWVPNKHWDLIVTMDDATSEVYSGFFVEEEGTHSSFLGVKETIEKKGLFCSFYTDRGSHYWLTQAAGEKVDKKNLTQFGRAMQQLGIEMIPAYSPEARGRSERLFGTVQQRLPKELALEGITDMQEANRFLREVYWPKHNKRFSVKPQEELSAFVPWVKAGSNLDDILCIQEQRVVNKDNTVSYKTLSLQIPKQAHRCHFIKAKVRVHEYPNAALAIFHGPRCLARYTRNGDLISPEKEEKKVA
jgi:transposase